MDPSPVVRLLTTEVGRHHRWCTPSILPDQERVEAFSQLTDAAVPGTVRALAEILGPVLLDEPVAPVSNPSRAIEDRSVMHPYAARRYAKSIGHELPLREAVGKVSAEHVEGFRVSADAVEHQLAVRDKGGAIVARDMSLATLRVL